MDSHILKWLWFKIWLWPYDFSRTLSILICCFLPHTKWEGIENSLFPTKFSSILIFVSFNGYLKLLYLLEKYDLKFKQLEVTNEYLRELKNDELASKAAKNSRSISSIKSDENKLHEILLFQINK